MGRPQTSCQTAGPISGCQTPGGATPAYQFSYLYDLAGEVEQETYPSGRIVTTCPDSAGRISSVVGKANSSATTSTIYAQGPSGTSPANIQYAPHGAISQLQMGNGLFETTNFTPHLQVGSIALGTVAGSNNVWGVTNVYSTTNNNNGDLRQQTISAPGLTGATQYFTYDALDRLLVASEKPSNTSAPACPDLASSWCFQFQYDIFGNRTIAQTSNTGISAPASISPQRIRLLTRDTATIHSPTSTN